MRKNVLRNTNDCVYLVCVNIVYYYPYIYTTKENENRKDEDKIQNR